MLQTDQEFAGVNSLGEGLKPNADGPLQTWLETVFESHAEIVRQSQPALR